MRPNLKDPSLVSIIKNKKQRKIIFKQRLKLSKRSLSIFKNILDPYLLTALIEIKIYPRINMNPNLGKFSSLHKKNKGQKLAIKRPIESL